MRFIWPKRRIVASKTLFVIFSALALFVSSGLSFALEFSADRVTRSGQQMRHQRVFYRDDMWRVEHNLPGAVNVHFCDGFAGGASGGRNRPAGTQPPASPGGSQKNQRK